MNFILNNWKWFWSTLSTYGWCLSIVVFYNMCRALPNQSSKKTSRYFSLVEYLCTQLIQHTYVLCYSQCCNCIIELLHHKTYQYKWLQAGQILLFLNYNTKNLLNCAMTKTTPDKLPHFLLTLICKGSTFTTHCTTQPHQFSFVCICRGWRLWNLQWTMCPCSNW